MGGNAEDDQNSIVTFLLASCKRGRC